MSSRDQRPVQRNDGYDGHANYRQEFAPRPARVAGRSFVRGLLAFGIGITVTWLTHKALHPGNNILLLFTGGIAAIVGLIAGCIAHVRLNRLQDGESRPLGVKDLVAAAIFVFGFVVPLSIEIAQDKREALARQAQERLLEQERKEALAQRLREGMEDLRNAGRFAEPGVVPPGFEVQDDGVSVKVRYHGDKGTSIALARVIRDARSPGGWRGCALWTGGPQGPGRYYGHYINPGMTLDFEMYEHCVEEFRGAPLEYRIGEPTSQSEARANAWWSTSAFAMPEGREWEHFNRRSAAQASAGHPR